MNNLNCCVEENKKTEIEILREEIRIMNSKFEERLESILDERNKRNEIIDDLKNQIKVLNEKNKYLDSLIITRLSKSKLQKSDLVFSGNISFSENVEFIESQTVDGCLKLNEDNTITGYNYFTEYPSIKNKEIGRYYSPFNSILLNQQQNEELNVLEEKITIGFTPTAIDVSEDGTKVVLGNSTNNSITIYTLSNGSWSSLSIGAPLGNTNFGFSVSISNNIIAVGSSESDRVYIYENNTVKGVFNFTGIGKNAVLSNDGLTVAFSSINGSDSYVYVYKWNGTSYDVVGEPIQYTFGGVETNTNITISGSGEIVAFTCENDGNSNNGQVKVYQFIESEWIQLGNDINESDNEDLGSSIKLNGNGREILIGSRNFAVNSDVGCVQMYTLINSVWTKEGDHMSSTTMVGDSVSLSPAGDVAVFSSVTSGNTNNGRIWLYNYFDGEWTKRVDISGNNNEYLGGYVSMSKDSKTFVSTISGGFMVYNIVKNTVVSFVQPINPTVGMLYYNGTYLKLWNGSAWINFQHI